MQKPDDAAGASSASGNASSADNAGQVRPWTDDEMAASKPLPLPTVDPAPKVVSPGVPHTGKGETKPAGPPEHDEQGAR